MDQRLALGACTPPIWTPPLRPTNPPGPPPPPGKSPPPEPPPQGGLRPTVSWGGGVVGVQNRGVAPPPPMAPAKRQNVEAVVATI